MGVYKEIFTEIQTEMLNVAEILETIAEEGDAEAMFDALIECTAKLAVVTRRYHQVSS